MKKTVIITGAYGFIGRYAAREYKINGYNVIGLGHGAWSKNEWLEWGIDQWHECDVTLENLVIYCGSTPEIIIHCAGSGSVDFSINYPLQDFERTVLTMKSVAEFVRVYSPKTKIVYPSSAAVYGKVNSLPISESSPLNPISPYGFHKKMAEDICVLYAKQYMIQITVVRLFSVYGEGLRKQLLWDACNKLKSCNYDFFGTGMEVRDWIHVKDVARLLYIAAEHANELCPIVNGGSGVPITVEAMLATLFTAFDSINKPNFMGVLNAGNPVQYQADIKKVELWHWTPKVNLVQGIRDYVAWYKEGAIYD